MKKNKMLNSIADIDTVVSVVSNVESKTIPIAARTNFLKLIIFLSKIIALTPIKISKSGEI